MNIGPYALANNLFAAPMAGVTDRPFRQLCKKLGAGYAVSEMVTSRRDLWNTLKTSRRADHEGEIAPIAVQIAGTDAQMMAEAAAYNVERGAQIIDINMGCPAKKVCNKWAGSALMQDETLALQIVEAVVAA
ncbi:MAG: tRNA-dihydrouridine synthase, partial [Polaromonas sp.]